MFEWIRSSHRLIDSNISVGGRMEEMEAAVQAFTWLHDDIYFRWAMIDRLNEGSASSSR